MKAAASLANGAQSGALETTTPVVFVDGTPVDELTIESLELDAPLDTRQARLSLLRDAGQSGALHRWAHRSAFVATPHRLIDDECRWSALVRGTLRAYSAREAAGVHADHLTLDDDWAVRMRQAVDTVWWANRDEALLPLEEGVMQAGPSGNRSATRFQINGRSVHVPASTGESWRVGDVLETIDAFGALDLSLALIPADVWRAPLLQTVDLGASIGAALRAVLEPYGLFIRRDLTRDGHTIIERRHVRPMACGRPIRMRWADLDRPLSDALRIDHDAPFDAARQWIAIASGWRIESTFELVAGWDPALAGATDSEYDRTQSSDFAKYANVYRQWVLNEDGRFSEAPYLRGAAFDLAAFFGDSRVRPQPLPFQDCVTLDDAGTARRPVVQVSTDAGASWSQYPGRVNVRSDRAAVVLMDDALPSGFLAAAQNGEARVRVTATLTNPQPVRSRRWQGNAFAGRGAPRVLRVDDAFQFRRVSEQSIHFTDVRDGVLAARQIDQRRELDAWLVDQLQTAQRRGGAALEGRGRVDLSGAWPWLRLGDRLLEANGEGATARDRAQAVAQRGAVIDALHIRFGVESRRGPRTTAHVRF